MNQQTDNSLPGTDRRKMLTRAGILGVALGLGTRSATIAQEASPESMAAHPLVGTWVIAFEVPGMAPAVAVFGGDGSFIDAAGGHAGVWEATGEQTALHTWVHVFNENGGTYVVISGAIEVDESGDQWAQTFSRMVVAANGTVLNTGNGGASAKRLRPVPEEEMGEPLSIVPEWTPSPATPAS